VIHNGVPRPRSAFTEEQLLLCREVLVHRAVEIQMIPGQVRKHRGMELHGIHTSERERVGGHFHCRVRSTLLQKPREQIEKVH
jgi:hypothetical protein